MAALVAYERGDWDDACALDRHGRRGAAADPRGDAAGRRSLAWRSGAATTASTRCSPSCAPLWQRDGLVGISGAAAAIDLLRRPRRLAAMTAVLRRGVERRRRAVEPGVPGPDPAERAAARPARRRRAVGRAAERAGLVDRAAELIAGVERGRCSGSRKRKRPAAPRAWPGWRGCTPSTCGCAGWPASTRPTRTSWSPPGADGRRRSSSWATCSRPPGPGPGWRRCCAPPAEPARRAPWPTRPAPTADALGARPLLAELRARQPARGRPAPGDDAALTAREPEMLALVAQGRSNGEIGRQLFISTKTVSVHVSNILAKLGAGGRTEAAAIARRDGLLPD